MEVDPGKLYGVVTGDVVGSSMLDPMQREALFQIMREGSQELQSWLGTKMPLEVDIYGGDTWQLLLTDPKKSLAAGLFYRAFLRSRSPQRDTRFVVAVAPIDFVPRGKVSEGDGEAFRLSGQKLSELKKQRMAFVSHDQSTMARWDVVFELIDALAHKWTEKQAMAITGAVRDWKQADIGQRFDPPIKQASVNRLLQNSGWDAIYRAATEFSEYWANYDGI